MIRHAFVGCVALVAAVAVGAEPDRFKPKPLVLSPAASPTPALRYPLLPPLRDQKPGNAAPLYRKAIKTLNAARPLLNDPTHERAYRWMAQPIERLRREVSAAKEYLVPLAPVFIQIEDAARCSHCDWGFLEEFQKTDSVPRLDFNETQRVREFVIFLQLRARIAVADDRPEDAVRDVQTVFAIARHLTQGETLIHCLVGNAFAFIGTGMIETIVEHPKAPNLYWALTELPRPFVDYQRAYQGEWLSFLSNFPGLREAIQDRNAGAIAPEKIAGYGTKLSEFIDNYQRLSKENLPTLLLRVRTVDQALDASAPTIGRMRFGRTMELRHEAAKRALIADGRPRDKVEQMPPLQVALLHTALDIERVLDEAAKWHGFPYPEASPALEALGKRLNNTGSLLEDAPALPVGKLLMPILTKAPFATARLERRFAALRCVEAIRLYSATHNGKMPASLDDIREVPIPIDPLTGKAFDYRLEGDHALLMTTVVKGEFAPSPRYAIALRK